MLKIKDAKQENIVSGQTELSSYSGQEDIYNYGHGDT